VPSVATGPGLARAQVRDGLCVQWRVLRAEPFAETHARGRGPIRPESAVLESAVDSRPMTAAR
jgi:hypothetical protein